MSAQLQPDLWDQSRKAEAIMLASSEPDFAKDFADWLRANWHIYLAFERRALRLANAGCKHFGPMDILGSIRWGTALREARAGGQEPEFKINNNRAPDLSRLFALLHPKHQDFFRQRARGKSPRGYVGDGVRA